MAELVMKQTKSEHESPDYVNAYERAMRNLISACGSKETANKLLGELDAHYAAVEKRLDEVEKIRKKDPEEYVREKAAILAKARLDVNDIIDRNVPRVSEHVRELIIGTSLATAALTLPLAGLSTLAVATAITAIGGSYYIGFKILRNWRAIAGRERVSSLAGIVGPKSVGSLAKMGKWSKKK